ncbi:MAG: hypothetical protein PHD12_04720 [Methylotenera sp.]|nr:hypothetical protein [Methylotenera sp.]
MMLFATIVVLTSFTAVAAPAPWYLWKSKLDGVSLCTQVPPGEGWLQLNGPYKDAHCTVHGRPGQ